ncbi:hypothetical protein TALK_15055 [Thalassospira alkalitolerans]|uniref:Uncharacterized protein n=1 Tax=Thalassospira alkalitolerans TaxID=1293890 RepID=A0A1Y2LAU6_9PROT|nr:hypothetical protein TALK_15055 [Thalassospira alkalitolerans]
MLQHPIKSHRSDAPSFAASHQQDRPRSQYVIKPTSEIKGHPWPRTKRQTNDQKKQGEEREIHEIS